MLLVSMPMGALERPSLGLSLLKARLAEEGIACDVRYLTFTFAEFIGVDDYQWMCYGLPYTAFAGDWSFTGALYDDDLRQEEYVRRVLQETWRLSHGDIGRILDIRSRVRLFLDHCMEAVRWGDYAVVGFTSTFEQNIASLAMAKRIKQKYPSIATIFGGANWEAGMGAELHRQFPFVDYVCSGEAEQSLPEVFRRHMAGEPVGESGLAPSVPGVTYRDGSGRSIGTGPGQVVLDLDVLPYPDYSDYFRELSLSTVASSISPTLLLETSRGCWWGAKSHCTFCGLNGGTMAFRSKSPGRAVEELESLSDLWRVYSIEAVDNILDMKYFEEMLPALARLDRDFELFYEVKSNLSRVQVEKLRHAGVSRIQPGIESLSDRLLKAMRKGTTALRNVQLLKWAQEYGIQAEWNLLYGFPGETMEDYRKVMQLLPAIRFLRPPGATGPIRLDRFSPYHNAPDQFGLTNIRPLLAYRYLYPFDVESLSRIAYYFDFDYEPHMDPAGSAAEVVAYADDWKQRPDTGSLTSATRADGTLTLLDTRSCATAPEFTFSGLEKEAYEHLDEVHSLAGVRDHLRSRFPEADLVDERVSGFLESLVANNLAITDGVSYLGLALRAPAIDIDEAATAESSVRSSAFV